MNSEQYIFNLSQRFNQIILKFGERIAIRYPDGQEYTYIEIDKISNNLSALLDVYKLKKGDVIAIFNEKSITSYCLMLACIKTGVIYTNLDVESPIVRLEKIIINCEPKVIFSDEKLIDPHPELKVTFNSIPIVQLKAFSNYNLKKSFKQKINFIEGSSPLYIMFTSGSTGFPKGATMSHSNVLNFIDWGRTTFSVSENDVFTNANPIYFDNSVFDFYVSIFNGATLVSLSHNLVKKPTELVKAINSSSCTIWFSVPSLLVYLLTTKVLTESDFPSIKKIIFGGEGFPKNKLHSLFQIYGNRIDLINVYGPTECTCICSSYLISSLDFEIMNELAPLGNIAPNFNYYILPSNKNETNLGELCLIGPCVGLGYYNDLERTTSSFIQDQRVKYAQIMYRTGDLVERAPNGYLHFKGRVDNQIKFMGYRIELEEIEAAFSSLNYINEVGVIHEKITEELGIIKVFVSVNKNIEPTEILNNIKQIVPSYMVPRKLIILDALPKNQNGKIDRNQLKLIK